MCFKRQEAITRKHTVSYNQASYSGTRSFSQRATYLWVVDWTEAFLLEFLSGLLVVPQVEFGPHQDDGSVGTVVAHLRVPLGERGTQYYIIVMCVLYVILALVMLIGCNSSFSCTSIIYNASAQEFITTKINYGRGTLKSNMLWYVKNRPVYRQAVPGNVYDHRITHMKGLMQTLGTSSEHQAVVTALSVHYVAMDIFEIPMGGDQYTTEEKEREVC